MKLHAIALGLLFSGTGIAHAEEVKYYEQAPSVEELERQIEGARKPVTPRRTRAIVFGDDPAEPAPASAPVAARQTEAAAPVPPAAYEPPPAAQSPSAPVAQSVAGEQSVEPERQQPSARDESAPASPRSATIAFPITFPVNSAQIQPESQGFLVSLAGLLRKDPALHLVIEGHTDISGDPAANMRLSRERARSVLDFLVDREGIDSLRLRYTGKGSSEPLEAEDPRSPKNRRVQFRIAG